MSTALTGHFDTHVWPAQPWPGCWSLSLSLALIPRVSSQIDPSVANQRGSLQGPVDPSPAAMSVWIVHWPAFPFISSCPISAGLGYKSQEVLFKKVDLEITLGSPAWWINHYVARLALCTGWKWERLEGLTAGDEGQTVLHTNHPITFYFSLFLFFSPHIESIKDFPLCFFFSIVVVVVIVCVNSRAYLFVLF